MALHEFEIHRNAEGSTLAYATPKDGTSGYRIAGPKAWGGSKKLAAIYISDSDLAEYIKRYAPGTMALLIPQEQSHD